MPAISAVSAVPALADAPAAKSGSDGAAPFAPVLATLLAPAQPAQSALAGDAPTTGTDLPPSCIALPLAAQIGEDADGVAIAVADPEPAATEPLRQPVTIAVAQPRPSRFAPGSDTPTTNDADPAPGRPVLTGPEAMPETTPTAVVGPVVTTPVLPAGAIVAAPREPTSDRPAVADSVAGRPAAPPAPVPPVVAPAAVVPALHAFDAALHRAVLTERRVTRETEEPAFAFVLTQSSTIAAPSAPLDVTQPRWPDAMVTRIEQIREAMADGDGIDTRIRLHPDALGAIEVAVRREGDGVSVRLHAADPATLRLLADAQPRLQELADARGLKLSGSGVDGGATDTGQRRQPATEPHAGSRASAPRSAAPTARDPDADTRLA